MNKQTFVRGVLEGMCAFNGRTVAYLVSKIYSICK